jgi:hypothetical protein
VKESSMHARVESMAGPVAVALVTLLAAPPVFARTVRCESKDYRYRFCSVRTYGDVELEHERSRSACRYGRTWGYDHRGIWVDRGCRADFTVDEGRHHRDDRRHRYDRYDYYRHDDHDEDSGKAAAVAAGAIGVAAIVAAIVNSKNEERDRSESDVPSWLIGRFEGYNTLLHHDVELEISPSGAVSWRGAGLPIVQCVY